MRSRDGITVTMTTTGSVTSGPAALSGGYRWNKTPGWRPDDPRVWGEHGRAPGGGGNSGRRHARLERFAVVLAEITAGEPGSASDADVREAGRLAGVGERTARAYRSERPRVVAGHRGGRCPEGCGCGGWMDTDPEHSADQGGQRALSWYACWIRPADYTVTAHKILTRCSDLGCEHERTIVSGAILNAAPLKILLVAEPGAGRIWRKLSEAEAIGHATAALAAAEAKAS